MLMKKRKRSGRRGNPLLIHLQGKKRFQPLNTQTLLFCQKRERWHSRAGRVLHLKHLSVPRTSPLLQVERKLSSGPGQQLYRQCFAASFNNSILAGSLEQFIFYFFACWSQTLCSLTLHYSTVYSLICNCCFLVPAFREADRVILTACQQQGASQSTFQCVSAQLGNKTANEVFPHFLFFKHKYATLIRLLNKYLKCLYKVCAKKM